MRKPMPRPARLPIALLAATALALGSLTIAALTFPAMAGPPDEPRVIGQMPEPGRPGGELRTLVGRERDSRLLHVFGYARLVEHDQNLNLVPDILAGYEVQDGRVFTFKLRRGHKWSDGQPFTSEDFRFWWEDVAQNPALSPVGPDITLRVDGELPTVEFPDELTVRFAWAKPNPFFLPALAAATDLVIFRPAHYLKQFHEKYQSPERIKELVTKSKSRDWAQMFLRKDRIEKVDNPDEPTLDPWMLTNGPPANRFVAVRNPYFHRVDAAGQQLPYIDKLLLDVTDPKLVPIKTGSGETDLQARHLALKDASFLKDSEARSGLATRLWREARGAHLALYPNLNASDPVWRGLFRDARFRKALSLALDRGTISQFLYYGLATPANNTVIEGSPLYSDAVAQACLGFDVNEANRLLDEIGLTKRDRDGVRLLPDGRRLELVVESAGEDSEQADVLELVRSQWSAVGFIINTRPSDREVLENRVFAGDALMTVGYGIDNGVPTPDLPPKDFAPVSQADQPQWPKWGQYYETGGKAGEAPDLPEARQLMDLYRQWSVTADKDRQQAIWAQMLQTYAPQCYTIGIVANVMQPVAVRTSLRNVPEEAIFNWEPHAQLGIYLPDTFFYAK